MQMARVMVQHYNEFEAGWVIYIVTNSGVNTSRLCVGLGMHIDFGLTLTYQLSSSPFFLARKGHVDT